MAEWGVLSEPFSGLVGHARTETKARVSAMSAAAALEPRLILVWAGVLLFIGGLLLTAFAALWGGRFKAGSRTDSAAGFRPRANWPGLVMVAAGIVCFLAAAAF